MYYKPGKLSEATRALLQHPEAMAYLAKRKVDLSAIGHFQLGIETRKTGRLRNRILFPLHDPYGRFVVYQGRSLDPNEQPKYLLPKYLDNGEQFEKKLYLYGLYESLEVAVQRGYIVIVEGNIDVITLWQCDIPTAATMGGGITEEGACLLKRYVDTAIVLDDNDKAGHILGDRTEDVLKAHQFHVYRTQIDYEGCKDPNDLFCATSPWTVRQQVLGNRFG